MRALGRFRVGIDFVIPFYAAVHQRAGGQSAQISRTYREAVGTIGIQRLGYTQRFAVVWRVLNNAVVHFGILVSVEDYAVKVTKVGGRIFANVAVSVVMQHCHPVKPPKALYTRKPRAAHLEMVVTYHSRSPLPQFQVYGKHARFGLILPIKTLGTFKVVVLHAARAFVDAHFHYKTVVMALVARELQRPRGLQRRFKFHYACCCRFIPPFAKKAIHVMEKRALVYTKVGNRVIYY